jgi:hypothetical protein
MAERLEGGCICGAVRYSVTGEPLAAGWCHCRTCQRGSGAPAVAWAEYPIGAVAIEGSVESYVSSADHERVHCARCHAYLFFRARPAPETVSVNLGSLDRPSAVTPRVHIFARSRVPWFPPDDLPAYDEYGPYAD